jgi:hypothetical protein
LLREVLLLGKQCLLQLLSLGQVELSECRLLLEAVFIQVELVLPLALVFHGAKLHAGKFSLLIDEDPGVESAGRLAVASRLHGSVNCTLLLLDLPLLKVAVATEKTSGS